MLEKHKMVIDKFHCTECAGQAKRKGEDCSTCDGEGNELKPVAKAKKKK